ncbi:MAG: DUF924 family protein [Novosphingobium sp.]|uniref:DUF924 family protein n=1 Tax=Novosphingobium sp. TaxID=1874826 RepID=UPI0030170EFC
MRRWAQDLRHFWFHELGPAHWFSRDDSVDREIARRFGPVLRAMAPRPASEFLKDAGTAQAAILLFDQVPRNVYRGSAQAFAHDAKAQALAREALRRGWLKGLSGNAGQFVLMPLMHSEAIADQRASCALFTAHGSRRNRSFAIAHWRMIARFGRFPHRNTVLGRTSTPPELRALAAGNSW